MFFGTIGDTLMMNAQVTPCPPQPHAVHIQADRFLAKTVTIPMLFFLGRVTMFTKVAAIPLATSWRLSNLVLVRCLFTVRTFHIPILLTIFATPGIVQTAIIL